MIADGITYDGELFTIHKITPAVREIIDAGRALTDSLNESIPQQEAS